MHSRTRFHSALCVAALTFAACGEDEAAPEETARVPVDGSVAPLSDAATKSPDGGVPAPDVSGESTACAKPPHANGQLGLPCAITCEQGWADCDGEIDNGCELAVPAADGCMQCPNAAAMRCLQPELCGLSKPECAPTDGLVWTSKIDTQGGSNIESIATGPGAGQVFFVSDRKFSATEAEGTSPGATLASVEVTADGGLQWAAQGRDGAGHLQRIGDKLYLHSGSTTNSGEINVAVFSLDGALLSQVLLDGFESMSMDRSLAADSAGNVYVTGDLAHNGGRTVIAVDAQGKQRWKREVAYALPKRCGLSGVGVQDMRVVGDKLLAVTSYCLIELRTSDGELLRAEPLFGQLHDAILRHDAAGNLYVADITDAIDVLPAPNLLPASFATGDALPDVRTVFVSKYRPDFQHEWSRSFASVGTFDEKETKLAGLFGFDLEPRSGVAYLLVSVRSDRYLIQIDAQGKSVGAASLSNPDYEASTLAVHEDGTPWLAGRMVLERGNGSGMFVWNLPFTGPAAAP
jgi:hypothetical protein